MDFVDLRIATGQSLAGMTIYWVVEILPNGTDRPLAIEFSHEEDAQEAVRALLQLQAAERAAHALLAGHEGGAGDAARMADPAVTRDRDP